MPSQFELLGTLRVKGIMNALVDPRLLPQQLVWTSRIPDTPATDEEIIARYEGTPLIADIIADDARAAVYSMGKFVYEANKIANLKIGVSANQSTLNQIDRLLGGGAGADDMGLFTNWQNTVLQNALLGVRQRAEQLRIAMLCDGVGFSYDRLGIKLSSVSWGMYPDLKVTVGTGWDTAASATPVNDIWSVRRTARVRYGIDFNRATMSTTALMLMIATTEFQNKARQYLAPNVSFTNINTANLTDMQRLASNVLAMEVELYDARAWQQNPDTGALTSLPLMPITNVILTSTANDGNRTAYDFGSGVVTESTVSRIAGGGIIGGPLTQRYGPVAYFTPTTVDLNSPGLTAWAVQRGFSRKFIKQASAVLSTGSYSDSISTAVPTYS
jgi:hypothetical protein